jgi:ParB family chromosome partitioning protein
LIAGGHRLAAVQRASLPTIKAIVKQRSDFASEAEIRLAEIVENFMRRELSVLDRAFDVAAWREVFEGVQGAIKPGRKAKEVVSDDLDDISRRFATNFTEAAQSALDLSRDAVFRALKIAKLGDQQRQRIALLPIADNQSELLALVAHKPERQAVIIDYLLDGATSVADAVAILDNVAPSVPRQPWERVSDTFSRLKTEQQARFFSLHEDAIAAWMASR